ncbi:hypothetical protein Gotur_010337 [Gossypium turneri]
MDEELANSNMFDDEEDTIEGQRLEEEEDEDYELCSVGMVLTDSVVHIPSMRQALAEINIKRVMKGTPWFFNRHLILFQRLEKGERSLQVPLYFTEFWVQIHYLSRGFMSEGMARQLGDFIGKFMEVPIRMRQMEDCKWLREDRSSSKSIVGGQLGDNGERLARVNPNLSPHQGRRGKDTTRLEGINYGGEDVRYMELGSDTKEIPTEVIDTKKRQRLYSMSSIVSYIVDSKNSPIISTATEKQTDRSQ